MTTWLASQTAALRLMCTIWYLGFSCAATLADGHHTTATAEQGKRLFAAVIWQQRAWGIDDIASMDCLRSSGFACRRKTAAQHPTGSKSIEAMAAPRARLHWALIHKIAAPVFDIERSPTTSRRSACCVRAVGVTCATRHMMSGSLTGARVLALSISAAR